MIDYVKIKRAAGSIGDLLPYWASVDTDDLAQEAALCALRGRQSHDGPMYDLLRRQGWIKNHRSSNKTQQRVYLAAAFDGLTPGSPESQWIAAIDVARLLAGLTPYQRQAVELHYLYGMREREMVDALSISVNAVRNRIHLGLQNMRTMIQ